MALKYWWLYTIACKHKRNIVTILQVIYDDRILCKQLNGAINQIQWIYKYILNTKSEYNERKKILQTNDPFPLVITILVI